MLLTPANVIAACKLQPNKALEYAQLFPLQAADIALAFEVGQCTADVIIQLSGITNGQGLEKMAAHHVTLAADMAVINPDYADKIAQAVLSKDSSLKVVEDIAAKLAQQVKSLTGDGQLAVRQVVQLKKGLGKLFAAFPRLAPEIFQAIQTADGQLAKELVFEPAKS